MKNPARLQPHRVKTNYLPIYRDNDPEAGVQSDKICKIGRWMIKTGRKPDIDKRKRQQKRKEEIALTILTVVSVLALFQIALAIVSWILR